MGNFLCWLFLLCLFTLAGGLGGFTFMCVVGLVVNLKGAK